MPHKRARKIKRHSEVRNKLPTEKGEPWLLSSESGNTWASEDRADLQRLQYYLMSCSPIYLPTHDSRLDDFLAVGQGVLQNTWDGRMWGKKGYLHCTMVRKDDLTGKIFFYVLVNFRCMMSLEKYLVIECCIFL